MVLERCAYYLNENSQIEHMDEELKNHLLSVLENFSNDALRTIAIAYRDFEPSSFLENERRGSSENDLETNLTFIGLLGLEDPLRPEVRNAVATCQQAGITVRMVTGDYDNTAKSIAKQCGILTKDGIVMSGKIFRTQSQQERNDVLPRLQVLARSQPMDKKVLVESLKALGEVVAVTGDGTNDAPALNKAHVGLAMGIEGTGKYKASRVMFVLS